MSAKPTRLLVLFTAAALTLLSGCKKAPPTLSLLVWEGYADPSFIQGFEAQCQCKVTAAYMGTSDELVSKLRGGASSNYDVISPSSDLSTIYMAAQVLGFGKPDPTAIYNLNDEQLQQVKQKLIALKPNIRKLWTTGGELTNLFQNHEVVAAMG